MKLTLVTAILILTGLIYMNLAAESTEVHPHADKLKTESGEWKYTNQLTAETSPYLLQHAHNPVNWYPWGEEAFEEARRTGKPIFLSIGYSTCYWCHVMERQVFEDPAIAEQMNEMFVNIKVDREERPDVDDLYMTATQLLTGSGGWPMSVFLTPPGAAGEDDPGLRPFFAGTYFPPTPQRGMPSFPQVMENVHATWQQKREAVTDQAKRVAEAVEESLAQRETSGPVTIEAVQEAANRFLRTYDAEHGGFGTAPKFPQPVNLRFLLAVYENTDDSDIWNAISHTLDRMARGGMYDQVGGGFHRYSTDEKWLVPHFEKMLYDNGQLLELYAAALPHAKDEHAAALYRRVMRETADYVLREMTDPTGAFWSAQDAEVDAREGGNYVWIESQVREAIPDEELADLAVKMYGLDKGSNFRDPHHEDAEPVNVLYLPQPLHELGDVEQIAPKRRQINEHLLAVRDKREQPGTDDKVLTSWNGLMIAGLARAGQALDEPTYIAAAARAADAVIEHMSMPDGGLYRTMRAGEAKIPGFLEDYAFFAQGLLALHDADAGGGKYLDAAQRYVDYAEQHFAAPQGGYFDTLADQPDLFVRKRGFYDGATPSGNSVMVHNRVDLYEPTEQREHLEHAVQTLRSFAMQLKQFPQAVPHMEHALLRVIETVPSDLREQLAAGAEAVAAGGEAEATDVLAQHDGEHVNVAVRRGEGEREFIVTLKMDEGIHINSNTPTDELLIPTTVELKGADGVQLEVAYPEPHMQQYPLADEPLSVYEGAVQIPVTLGDDGSLPDELTLAVQYQACNDHVCFAQQTVELTVPTQE